MHQGGDRWQVGLEESAEADSLVTSQSLQEWQWENIKAFQEGSNFIVHVSYNVYFA